MQLEALVDNLDPDKAGQQTFLGRHLGETDAAKEGGGGEATEGAGGAAGGGGAAEGPGQTEGPGETEGAAALRQQRARSG